MNPENNNEMIATLPNDPLVKQPHPVNQVTRVSKYLALTLFVILPFIGAYVGYKFGDNEQISNVDLIVTAVENKKDNLDTSPNISQVDTNFDTKNSETAIFSSIDGQALFNDPELGISFTYPVSWGEIALNYEEDYCENKDQKCKFYTFAPSNDPVRIFLVAQTLNKPLIGRGAFWGDSMNYSLKKETTDLCRANDLCTVLTNSHSLNFTKQTNVHSCEEGEGCEGKGDYYQLFHPGSGLVKFSLATYRLTDEDKKKFEDIVINSFNLSK